MVEQVIDNQTKSVRQFADREGGFKGGRERVANPFFPSLTKNRLRPLTKSILAVTIDVIDFKLAEWKGDIYGE